MKEVCLRGRAAWCEVELKTQAANRLERRKRQFSRSRHGVSETLQTEKALVKRNSGFQNTRPRQAQGRVIK